MNLDYALAACFGLGVAGAISGLFQSQDSSLATRVRPQNKPSTARRPRLARRSVAEALRISVSAANRTKLEKALFELPEIVDLLVVSLRSGDGIFRSFEKVVPRCEGELARELTRVLRGVEYGAPFGDELRSVAISLPHPQVTEFVNKVVMSLQRGTPLAQMLRELSESVRAEIRNRLLRQAGKNETRMLVPLVFLILPITVLFAIYPSLELLNFGFI